MEKTENKQPIKKEKIKKKLEECSRSMEVSIVELIGLLTNFNQNTEEKDDLPKKNQQK